MADPTSDFAPLGETNAGPWEHLDGTPCPTYYADKPTPSTGSCWWCTEHQQYVRSTTNVVPLTNPDPPWMTVLGEVADALWQAGEKTLCSQVHDARKAVTAAVAAARADERERVAGALEPVLAKHQRAVAAARRAGEVEYPVTIGRFCEQVRAALTKEADRG